ncbi:MAG: hypothetical protein Q4B73_08335 [Lachnospiraceae bacterium]|nr:hypothetical protein [Lachnospiraceae bacterium]
MRRAFVKLLAMVVVLTGCIGMSSLSVCADDEGTLSGLMYNLGEKEKYDYSKAEVSGGVGKRFYVEGDYERTSAVNGFTSFAVHSGNLKIFVDEDFAKELIENEDAKKWHVINDNSKEVNGSALAGKVGSGAILVQTSKDGKAWITVDSVTDFNNHLDSINVPVKNEIKMDSFYETTDVQLVNGCYYRIIVAYKLQREAKPTRIGLYDKKNPVNKEQIEVYQFYAFDPSVDRTEELDKTNAYAFSDVYRADSPDGFELKEGTKKLLDSDDPHCDWNVGRFYISGYTGKNTEDSDCPVFFKTPGDKVALWFNLEQELDSCNKTADIQVYKTPSGSDIEFGTLRIDKFGRGALFVRKTDNLNNSERQIYTNYLEASATVGANTRVDLFEEGDYEISLDYQLHFDKPFVFGLTTTKTLTYKMPFKFKVRNGDISAFIREVDTGAFISNANVAENGFYIDLANSKYLDLSIEREAYVDSLDGPVLDTKTSVVAKEFREYKDEGIYTVTVENKATGKTIEKKVYVGDEDVLKVHVATGMPLDEIKERMARGAVINDNGQLIDISKGTELEENASAETTLISPDVNMTESDMREGTESLNEESVNIEEDESQNKATGDNIPSKKSTHIGGSKEGLVLCTFVGSIIVLLIVILLVKKGKKRKG